MYIYIYMRNVYCCSWVAGHLERAVWASENVYLFNNVWCLFWSYAGQLINKINTKKKENNGWVFWCVFWGNENPVWFFLHTGRSCRLQIVTEHMGFLWVSHEALSITALPDMKKRAWKWMVWQTQTYYNLNHSGPSHGALPCRPEVTNAIIMLLTLRLPAQWYCF